MSEHEQAAAPEVTHLTARQRRVLGVLVEKGLTTPDAYPLTLKALTAGCNQKSNRDPVTNDSEDDVLEAVDQLRKLGLVAVVHTQGGRTERYRHYVRQRFPFTEPQLAIVTELLLRGRQTLGELRARASRMVSIDSLDQLREELRRLIEMGYVEASGSLERRGVEVDHTFYQPDEQRALGVAGRSSAPAPIESPPLAGSPSLDEVALLRSQLQELQAEHRQTREELGDLKDEVDLLSEEVRRLRRDLGD